MNIMKKNFAFASLLLIIIAVGGSYFRSFTECKIKIGKRIEEAFQKKTPLWGDCILHSKGILYIGNYDSREYANKKMEFPEKFNRFTPVLPRLYNFPPENETIYNTGFLSFS